MMALETANELKRKDSCAPITKTAIGARSSFGSCKAGCEEVRDYFLRKGQDHKEGKWNKP